MKSKFTDYIMNNIEMLVSQDSDVSVRTKGTIQFLRQVRGERYTSLRWANEFRPFLEAADQGRYIELLRANDDIVELGLKAFYIGGPAWQLFKLFCHNVEKAA